ncbi:extracellular solute-binding protein [Mahella australiensis]|uniref:Extracellular solute-binding protein family 1 n=1 Tax=Mahella australiensis (strain DSM 15567 / CIP 107919 / 50-1 BON) TaxID=697281 RepID=F4A122_MAHA5|nr:extracellular solute-binding protein [Mahella australiensis]AEE95925.1 extracellular solute-binding protein family 1 [Mahella australiensis 50-1 BON]
MKRYVKILALSLAIVLAMAAFAGCSGSDEKQGASTPPAQSGDGGDKQNEQQQTAPVTIKMFANFTPAQPPNAVKSAIEAVEKANNVKLEFEIPPATNYAERQQIMMASGEYPDVVLFNSNTDKILVDAVSNGVVIPITQYVKDAPNLQKYTYPMSWDSMKLKGDEDIYGIPRTSVMRADGYIVRKDWLDNVGLSIPENGQVTLDEFAEILKRFTSNDPDKNDKNDTYGFAANADGNGYIWPIISWPFGLLGWQEHAGQYAYMDEQYCKEHDNYKQALEYTAKLYKEGAIDPDYPVQKRETAIERFKQGTDGVIGEFSGWIAQYIQDMEKINPNAELTYITGIKDANGQVKGTAFGTGYWGLWVITKSAKNPEAIVKMFDWMLSDEGWPIINYGPEGVTYTVQGDKKVPTEAYAEYSATGGWLRATVRRNNDPDFFIPLNMPEDFQPRVRGWLDQAIKQCIPSKNRDFRPAAADKPEYIDYQKTYAQIVAKIITGELPVSEYDKALDGWYKAGGEEYVQQMNDYIKKAEGK